MYLPGFSWSGKGSLGCWGTPSSASSSPLGETKGETILIAKAISGSASEPELLGEGVAGPAVDPI